MGLTPRIEIQDQQFVNRTYTDEDASGDNNYIDSLAHWLVLRAGRLDHMGSRNLKVTHTFLSGMGSLNLVEISCAIPEKWKFACKWRQIIGIGILNYTQHVSNIRTEQSELYPFALVVV